MLDRFSIMFQCELLNANHRRRRHGFGCARISFLLRIASSVIKMIFRGVTDIPVNELAPPKRFIQSGMNSNSQLQDERRPG
jgi:hypothetical protein